MGWVEIWVLFWFLKVGFIVGCLVILGVMWCNVKVWLLWDNIVVVENFLIVLLCWEKDDVIEVCDGFECGLILGYVDIKEGDVIEFYELV